MNVGVSPAEGVASRGRVARLDWDAEITVRGTAVGFVDWREKEYVVAGASGAEARDIALSSSSIWRFSWLRPRPPMSWAETRKGTMANADRIKGTIDGGGRRQAATKSPWSQPYDLANGLRSGLKTNNRHFLAVLRLVKISSPAG